RFCGKEMVIFPVAADTVAWVDESDNTPALLMVTLEPRATAPPPDNPVPAVTVTDEFARFALVIPAVPERLLLVKPEMVFDPAAIVLLVKVSVLFLPTNVSEALGKVKDVASVPAKVKVVLIVTVLPLAIVNPFTVVALIVPVPLKFKL